MNKHALMSGAEVGRYLEKIQQGEKQLSRYHLLRIISFFGNEPTPIETSKSRVQQFELFESLSKLEWMGMILDIMEGSPPPWCRTEEDQTDWATSCEDVLGQLAIYHGEAGYALLYSRLKTPEKRLILIRILGENEYAPGLPVLEDLMDQADQMSEEELYELGYAVVSMEGERVVPALKRFKEKARNYPTPDSIFSDLQDFHSLLDAYIEEAEEKATGQK